MRILVTDGGERASLAVVRSLGRTGHRIGVISREDRSLAGASRFAAWSRPAPDPLHGPEAFARTVSETVAERGVECLIPVSEASLHAVLPRREAFAGARIPFPDHGTFDAVCDKARVSEVAGALEIEVPRQVRVEDPGEGVAAGREASFPLVVKPARSVVGSGTGRVETRVRYARDRRDLARVLEATPAEAYPVLLQERIEGPGIGVFLLLWEDELLAAFCHRRLREKPPSGGVSVLRESVAPDRSLVGASRRLLDAFGWSGVAMVEYKRDRATGTPYLMEVNGRFWGSLQLAVDAGVDFPRLLVEAAAGRTPEPVLDYEEGVRTRWLLGDVDHLLARLRRSPDELGPGDDAPGRAKALAAFLASFGPGNRNEVFRWSDPRPGLREAGQWIEEATDGRPVQPAPERPSRARTE